MDPVVKITLHVPDQQALKEALALVPGVHLDCGTPRPHPEGGFVLNVFGSAADARKLSKAKVVLEIDEQYGEQLKARQAEVAQGDRFKGGTVKPEGLGIKRPERHL
jgi:hypothetical protein